MIDLIHLIAFYLFPVVCLMATNAPEIQLTPRVMALAMPRPGRRLPVLVILTLTNLVISEFLFVGFGYEFIPSEVAAELFYIWFAIKMGPYL